MASNSSNPLPIFASRKQVTAALERAAERARVLRRANGHQVDRKYASGQANYPRPEVFAA